MRPTPVKSNHRVCFLCTDLWHAVSCNGLQMLACTFLIIDSADRKGWQGETLQAEEAGRTSAWNCWRMRTFCQRATPLGRVGPFMPGLKSRLDTILRVVWMSKTQCAAVSTCRVPIKLPVHSSALCQRDCLSVAQTLTAIVFLTLAGIHAPKNLLKWLTGFQSRG